MVEEKVQIKSEDNEEYSRLDKSIGRVNVHRAVARCPDISYGAKAVYLVLCSYTLAGENVPMDQRKCYVSQSRLAEEVGLCTETFRQKIDELEKIGLLSVEKRHMMGATNVYWLRKIPMSMMIIYKDRQGKYLDFYK